MEAALRENRMTLEAIRVTQSDRDLFKHLISEATNYVAADYMRHANERRIHLDKSAGVPSRALYLAFAAGGRAVQTCRYGARAAGTQRRRRRSGSRLPGPPAIT